MLKRKTAFRGIQLVARHPEIEQYTVTTAGWHPGGQPRKIHLFRRPSSGRAGNCPQSLSGRLQGVAILVAPPQETVRQNPFQQGAAVSGSTQGAIQEYLPGPRLEGVQHLRKHHRDMGKGGHWAWWVDGWANSVVGHPHGFQSPPAQPRIRPVRFLHHTGGIRA